MLEKNVDFAVYTKTTPNEEGFFGSYGGSFIPPQLVGEFEKISTAYHTICKSSKFINELRSSRDVQHLYVIAKGSRTRSAIAKSI